MRKRGKEMREGGERKGRRRGKEGESGKVDMGKGGESKREGSEERVAGGNRGGERNTFYKHQKLPGTSANPR